MAFLCAGSARRADAACVEIECPRDIEVACTGPGGAMVTFSPTATSSCDAPFSVICNPPSGSVFPIGPSSVQCSVVDTRGNAARCEFRVLVTNAPPRIQCPPDLTLTATGGCYAVLPAIPVAVEERCTPTNQLVFSQSPPAGTKLSPGEHAVTITVSEGAHISSSCIVMVKVVDGQGPVISVPKNVKAWCAPKGTTVNFVVTAFDACDGVVEVECAPVSGSFFPAGTTTVTCAAKDASGNSTTASFPVTVTGASQTMFLVAGAKDGFALPADPSQKSPCLWSASAGISLGSQFDQSFPGRWLGHSFLNLPGLIDSLTLRARLRPLSSAASNDVIRIGLVDCVPGSSSWAYSEAIAKLPESGGVWQANNPIIVTINLTSLLPTLNLAGTGRLDILIGDDTMVDWLELAVGTCEVAGAANGVPYVMRNGVAARGAGGRLQLRSDVRLPFDVDFNLGQADGVEISFGDWPGATNPPIDPDCLSFGELVDNDTKIEWNPGGELLCTVQFLPDASPSYSRIELTQPTNIVGGRAVEVWSKGQFVSRFFYPSGPSAVVLPDNACLLSMGFLTGEFFMALRDPAPVSFGQTADYVSGQKEAPVEGDFIRMVFNVPFTVGGGPEIRFDPDIILKVKGREIDIRDVSVSKFGALFHGDDDNILAIGDGLTVVPGSGETEQAMTLCFDVPVKADGDSTGQVSLSMQELFACPTCTPGQVVDIVAKAQYGTTPPLPATIGRLRVELVSANPLRVRVRANYDELFLKTHVTLITAGGLHSIPGAEELEVAGGLHSIVMSVVDNEARFIVYLDPANGLDATVDGQAYAAVKTAVFSPAEALPGVHRAPYSFCVAKSQAWVNMPLDFTSPIPQDSNPSEPPFVSPRSPYVWIDAPARLTRWTDERAGLPAEFAVRAYSTAGSNVQVQCWPRSGSVFPVGITFVSCVAADELGNSARHRFPVAVYPATPRLDIEPGPHGSVLIRWPDVFDGWHLEASSALPARAWMDLGTTSVEDRLSRVRLLPADARQRYFRLSEPQ